MIRQHHCLLRESNQELVGKRIYRSSTESAQNEEIGNFSFDQSDKNSKRYSRISIEISIQKKLNSENEQI